MHFLKKPLYACLILFVLGCKNANNKTSGFNNPAEYIKTVRQLNEVVVQNIFPPMIASRNYAYANIAAYETLSASTDSLETLHGKINELPVIPKPARKPINAHFAALIAFCRVGNAVTFPEGSLNTYVDSLTHKAVANGMDEEVIDNSKQYAEEVTKAIMTWAKGDNYSKTRSAKRYAVSKKEDQWVPTPPAYTTAIEPHWNEIRPLLISSCSAFLAPRPPAYNIKDKQSPFYKEVMEVKTIADNLNEDQKSIARFWDDNPFQLEVTGHTPFAVKKFSPPGHWMNIIGISAKQQKLSFIETVAIYTYASVAIFDGFITCWDEKYRSNVVRPETVINRHIDPKWQPLIQTPAFPEYTSGHAVISRSVAEILTAYFGDSFAFTDTTQQVFGLGKRSFTSFRQAADEAGISRVYGGIHYRNSYSVGALQGEQLGKFVVKTLDIKLVKK